MSRTRHARKPKTEKVKPEPFVAPRDPKEREALRMRAWNAWPYSAGTIVDRFDEKRRKVYRGRTTTRPFFGGTGTGEVMVRTNAESVSVPISMLKVVET